jgi:ribosomal protein S18 acetylase RimI-like enzyme
MGVVIRAAAPEDSAEIARIQVDTWRTTYRGIVPQSFLDEMEYDVRARNWQQRIVAADSRICVAELDGGVCGFISGGRLREPVSDFDGEIFAIYILAEAQRRGLGAAMMQELARQLLEDGVTSAIVWVLRENPACDFYARLGGELVGQKTIEIGGSNLIEVAYGWTDLRRLAESAAG